MSTIHSFLTTDHSPLTTLFVCLVLTLAWGRPWIDWLRSRFREPIKGDSARLCELQQNKSSTPTMGGLFIIIGLLIGLVLCGNLSNHSLQTAILLAVGLATVGGIDDLVKLRRSSNGLSARIKLIGQIVVCTVAALLLYTHQAERIPLGVAFIPWAVLVMVGTSNAVNLTDGLDGLAAGCLITATAAIACAAWWNSPQGEAHEILVLAGAMIGVLVGFLRFNRHPAKVFMGDTGSLPLGGLLGLLALITHQELLLAVVGAVFVVEAGSVILQVGYYKWRRRRIFLCAPLHHHFQFLGWSEKQIVTRFWAASALCALLGLFSAFFYHSSRGDAEARRKIITSCPLSATPRLRVSPPSSALQFFNAVNLPLGNDHPIAR